MEKDFSAPTLLSALWLIAIGYRCRSGFHYNGEIIFVFTIVTSTMANNLKSTHFANLPSVLFRKTKRPEAEFGSQQDRPTHLKNNIDLKFTTIAFCLHIRRPHGGSGAAPWSIRLEEILKKSNLKVMRGFLRLRFQIFGPTTAPPPRMSGPGAGDRRGGGSPIFR